MNKNRNITDIVVHCTASKEGVDIGVSEIDTQHKARGFRCVGYHYIVRLDGTIEVGRPESKIGAHVKGFNTKSIGVVYVGGLDKKGKAKDTRTKEQKESLIKILKDLKLRYSKAKISGHRDFSKDLNGDGVITSNEWTKMCPCFDAKLEYEDI